MAAGMASADGALAAVGEGTNSIWPQAGHLARLPANASGARSFFPQKQVIGIGMPLSYSAGGGKPDIAGARTERKPEAQFDRGPI